MIKEIANLIPDIKAPEVPVGLKEKLYWTGIVLVVFFVLGQIYPIGVSFQGVNSQIQLLQVLLGSSIGSLTTLGIGPIVFASIILQLAVGTGLLGLDTSTDEGKQHFQSIQKLLIVALAFIEGIIFVLNSQLVPVLGVVSGTSPLFGSVFLTELIVIIQIAFGAILVMFLDELVQKYGIGSGVSLFIVAGVALQVFVGVFSISTNAGIPVGLIPQSIYYLIQGSISTAIWVLIPLFFTIIVFLITVYLEGMKIELPLTYGMARGLGARYPIKFLYVSVMPVILAFAVIFDVQLVAGLIASHGITILGVFSQGVPVQSLSFSYLISNFPSPLLIPGGYSSYLSFLVSSVPVTIFGSKMVIPLELIHILVYGLVLVLLCVVFGWFWIETTGMSSKDVAKQLMSSGLQIPGFRQDPRVIEKVLDRYIPIITILGSVTVGLLAWFAQITGALGTGIGILLAVGITYQFYEQLVKDELFEIYPTLEKFVKR
ncbi:MAG: preprotein translocase subunit SecY [Candidatus Marsarchaeota archaeon]|nr:preprotein translocase subunit SecY [Candidatus Marsarchaeota archaeon]